MLDPESLRCFEAAAVLLNFRQAAARVALSPAALSDRIRRLEEALGEPLFHRTTRRVRLTEAGARLLPHARELMEADRRCHEAVRGTAESGPVALLLGTRFELGLSWLVPALPHLETLQPQRRLDLHFGEGPDLLARVRQGRLDAAITSTRIADLALDYRVLHPEAYVVAGETQTLAERPLRGPEDAPGHTLIDLTHDLPLARYLLEPTGGSALWRFRDVACLGTIGAVRLRVLQGAGIAVLPEYFVREDLRRGRLLRLMPEVPLPEDAFRLLWRRDHPHPAALARLAEDLAGIPLR